MTSWTYPPSYRPSRGTNNCVLVMSTPALQTRHVFIDTEVFIKNNYPFDSVKFSQLTSLAQSEKVTIYLTIITVQEIRSNIEEDVIGAYQAIEKIRKRILKNIPEHPIHSQEIDAEKAKLILLGQFEKFLSDARVQIVDITEVSIEKVVADYFARKPPFSEKKRSEFPDAFALEALRKKCQETSIQMYVISGDPDMDSACKDAVFISIELGQLLEIFTAQEKVLHDYAVSLFDRHAHEISERLKQNTRVSYWPYASHERVESTYITLVNILDKNLIKVSERKAVFEVIANVHYTSRVLQHVGFGLGFFGGVREDYKYSSKQVRAEVSLEFNQDDEGEFAIEMVVVNQPEFSFPYVEPNPSTE
jgi:hypothetical protein